MNKGKYWNRSGHCLLERRGDGEWQYYQTYYRYQEKKGKLPIKSTPGRSAQEGRKKEVRKNKNLFHDGIS